MNRKKVPLHPSAPVKRAEQLPVRSPQELPRQENDLPNSRELPRHLMDRIPNAVLVVKADLEVVFANVAVRRALGLRNKRIEGKPLNQVLPMAEVEPLVKSALKVSRPLPGREVIYRHPTKGHRWLRISASRLLDEKGDSSAAQETRLVLVLDDVTEWRQAQEKIQETGRLISLGEIIAEVAHELNNPLTSVMGFAQLLVERGAAGSSRADLEMIFTEAQRATKIVRNLLSFVRKQPPEKTVMPVAPLIERILALKAYDLQVCNIEVQASFPPDLSSIYADPHALEQVFLNIVTNAQQAMQEAHGEGRLTIRGTKEQGMVRISFMDNGPGILPDTLKNIFKPYFTTKEEGQGTGLGLSICKSLVQEQGGKIWAESKRGKGAVFHVEVPAKEE